MSVKITDICISCGSCIDECPVSAIVDDDDNPTGEGIYYVYADKCVECVGHNDAPRWRCRVCLTRLVFVAIRRIF